MILKGFTIQRGQTHATHLMRADENEHVELHEVRGFASGSLHGAFKEAQAIAGGTKCKQYLFSCVFSPPNSVELSTDQFMCAVDRTEQALGLEGQPRAVVFHEKDGRRHAHCVWSRIDAQTMTARQLSHWKNKLGDVSRALHQEFGIEMPRGLKDKKDRDPLNFTQAEAQQAKRQGEDPRWLKSTVQDCWVKSDDRKSFEKALEEQSLSLARGDKRGFVVVDFNGSVHSLPKLLGIKTKEVRAKLGEGAPARSVADIQRNLAERKTPNVRAKVETSRERFRKRHEALKAFGAEMTHLHRNERAKLAGIQSSEWMKATQERQARMPRGIVRAVWAWVSGETARIKGNNEAEAKAQAARQTKERDELAARQREERRVLVAKIVDLRKSQAEELQRLRRDLAPHFRATRSAPPRQDVLAARLGLKLER